MRVRLAAVFRRPGDSPVAAAWAAVDCGGTDFDLKNPRDRDTLGGGAEACGCVFDAEDLTGAETDAGTEDFPGP